MQSDVPQEMKDYLYELFVNMAVSRLEKYDVRRFVDLLNDGDEDGARELVIEKIPDFEKQYETAIKHDMATVVATTK